MTQLTGEKRVIRETAAAFRGRNLVVTVLPHTLIIREKGRRKGYEVSYHSIFKLGAVKQAEAIRRERAEKKKASKRRAS